MSRREKPLNRDTMAEYGVRAKLLDGRAVRLRFLQPADRDRVRTGFQDLSRHTIHLRFMAQKSGLSEQELDLLTHPDLDRHVCLAVELDQDGEATGVGLGRYAVDLGSDPLTAEFGLVVADQFQGLGAGTLLLRQLCEIARRQGICCLRGVMLAENQPMLEVLQNLGIPISLSEVEDGLEVHVELRPRADTGASRRAAATPRSDS